MTAAEQRLSDAGDAWVNKLTAEAQLARLQRYGRMNAGMKADQQRYSRMLADANATLNRVLLGGAE